MSVPVHEAISVAVIFEHGQPKPVLFRWKNKKVVIDRISFTWQTKEGTSLLLHFTAIADRTLYELVFNTRSLVWRLEQISTGV